VARKFLLLVFLSLCVGSGALLLGMHGRQALALSVFSASILGTLLFWHLRLIFAFLGSALLLGTQTLTITDMFQFASLDVILFLVGMMILVGLLRDTGFFVWIVSLMLRSRNPSATKVLVSIACVSAFSACIVDEVTSIIFVAAAVFELCDYFEVDPVPYLMIAIFATNVGSSGTVLGNPIGILIASKAGLSFEDFLVHAFPVMLLVLGVAIVVLRFYFRKDLDNLETQIRAHGENEILVKLLSVPPDRDLKISMGILAVTVALIAFHRRFEALMSLPHNTLLVTIPLACAGGVMAWKHHKARKFVERDVEWWTLLFFMLLFAQAETLKVTGVTDFFAARLMEWAGTGRTVLISVVLWGSTLGSSMLDNVVLVAAFIPMIKSFEALGVRLDALWWALLFGGCLGGNITLIGSTANIVALGILEKERHSRISFMRWFKVGALVGACTVVVVWLVLLFVPLYQG
jgi:Na+/H+ antiporter NhaD/arsenite permease-like protein